MKKILPILLLPLVMLTGCELDYYPTNSMTSDQLAQSTESVVYMTSGNYMMFKDHVNYGSSSGNTYVRHYFQMAEFRGDNVSLSNTTSDKLYGEMRYSDLDTDAPLSYMWYICYNIAYGANSVIEALAEGRSDELDHLLGENYYMRANAHFDLLRFFAKPYVYGRDNLGVILRTSTDTSVTKRASVGECYDQVVKDLQKAVELMGKMADKGTEAQRVTMKGYISRDTALGLLSRVYLYMGEDDLVISTVEKMLAGADPASKLDPDLTNYFATAPTSKETLWCIYHDPSVPEDNQGRSSISSMYYTPDQKGTGGWCEMYYTDPLLKLFKRFPNDGRLSAYLRLLNPVEGKKQVRWPVEDPENDFRLNKLYDVTGSEGNYSFTDDKGATYTVTEKMNKLDKEYWVNYEGKDVAVYIDDKCESNNTLPAFMCRKFTDQDGQPQLCSPVLLRWGEIILNRAEAYARKGLVAEALADVNVIRARAGIDAWTASSYASAGYTDILDVVLDERRLELCYEGHRGFDLYRNKKSMDRRFSGVQIWEVVEPTDARILYHIPFDEYSVSGIEKNH